MVHIPTLLIATLFTTSLQDGQPIPVRFEEGVVHGFLTLTSAEGDSLARGDLLQVQQDGTVHARMIFRFNDGSLLEESVRFTQDKVFRMLDYHLVQRGPAFPRDLDARLDAATGKYRVETRDRRKGETERHDGVLDLPPDVYNGMVIVVSKNIPRDAPERFHFVAFTPKPRVIELAVSPVGEEDAMHGEGTATTTHYLIQPKLGFPLGILARVTGRYPPDGHVWIVTDDVPAFLTFQGALVNEGPLWRIDLTTPSWPARAPRTATAPDRKP